VQGTRQTGSSVLQRRIGKKPRGLGTLKALLKQIPEPNARDARISPGGQVDVFLTRFPSGEGQWQVGTQGGKQPRWATDSRELIFIAGSGPTKRSMVSTRVDHSLDSPLGTLTVCPTKE